MSSVFFVHQSTAINSASGYRKLLFFEPAVLLSKTPRNKAKRRFDHLHPYFLLLREIGGGRHPRHPLEESAEGGQAFKSDGITGIRYRPAGIQQFPRLFHPHMDKILMRGPAVNMLELFDKMELRKVSL